MRKQVLLYLLGIALALPSVLLAEAEQRYFDGRQWRTIWLDRSEVAELVQEGSDSTMRALVPTVQLQQQGRRLRIWKLDEAMSLQQLTRNLNSVEQRRFLPVFRLSANGGARLVLAGNLVVRFKQSTDQLQAQAWGDEQGLSLVQKMSLPDTYLFAVAEEVVVLDKANQIQQSGVVQYAVPQWLRPAYKR